MMYVVKLDFFFSPQKIALAIKNSSSSLCQVGPCDEKLHF